MLTGQSVIHPDDDQGSGQGADAWLRRLWDAAYAEALGGNRAPLAFMTGFLTHAAGDMYAHTFVNAYSGGEFDISVPDNVSTHVVVEGFVGNLTPTMPSEWYAISTAGVDEFIYEQMVDVTRVPRTAIYDLYAKKSGSKWSLPWLFGEIRSVLEEHNRGWQGLNYPDPRKIFGAPLHAYRKAWQADIDRGLRRWPSISTQVGRHLFYNEARRVELSQVGDVLNDYLYDHVLKMLGAPDFVADFAGFIDGVLDTVARAVEPLAALNPLRAIQEAIFDYLINKATGRTPDEWRAMFEGPENFMVALPRLTNSSPKLCPTTSAPALSVPLDAQLQAVVNLAPAFADCKHEVERALALTSVDGELQYQWDRFRPALNTVFMSKLLLLDANGRRTLMRQLGYPDNVPLAYSLVGQSSEVDNAMLGFMRSLDGQREWSNHDSQMIAHFDCYMYSKVFADQKGARVDEAKALTYLGGDAVGMSRECPEVNSVAFDLGAEDPNAPFCGSQVTARVGLHRAADGHGAVVELERDGPIVASNDAYVQPGASEVTVDVSIAPVSSIQTISLNATRIETRTGVLQVRPPEVSALRVQRRHVGGYVSVRDGDSVIGGTDLLTEVRLDCSNAAGSDEVYFEACPLNQLPQGPCVTDKMFATPGTAAYDAPLGLPPVAIDTQYKVRGEFLGTDDSIEITVLATRVKSVIVDHTLVPIGVGSQPLIGRIELLGPALQPETVFLRYSPSLSGPRSVVVPEGQTSATFTVQAQPYLLANKCSSTVDWVEAISERDAPGPGLNTGRERYGEVIIGQNGEPKACIEMLSPDIRLQHVWSVLDVYDMVPVPTVLFKPEDGLIGIEQSLLNLRD